MFNLLLNCMNNLALWELLALKLHNSWSFLKILKKINIKKWYFAASILIWNIVQIQIYAISRNQRGFLIKKNQQIF